MNKILLPFRFRIIGLAITLSGLLVTWVRFGLSIKPAELELPVFAFYSSFFKTVWFSTITNNISEEICLVLLLTGIFFIAFSREKNEKEQYNELRYESLLWALLIDFLFIVTSVLFVFGVGFISMVVIHLFTPFVFYIIILRIRLFKFRNK